MKEVAIRKEISENSDILHIVYLYFNTQCVILHTVCNLNLSVILHRTQLQNCANLEKIHLCYYGRVGRLLDRSHGNKRLLTGLMATDSYPHTKC